MAAHSRAQSVTTPRLPVGADDVAFPTDVLGRLLPGHRAAAIAHGRREQRTFSALKRGGGGRPPTCSRPCRGRGFRAGRGEAGVPARRWQVYVGRPAVRRPDGWRRPALPRRVPIWRADGRGCGTIRLRRIAARLWVVPESRGENSGARWTAPFDVRLCGTEWEAVRLSCAVAGRWIGTPSGSFRLDDADVRWIETCERCKGYVKTVDERKLPEGETVFPVVEEAATLHLDLLAEREGTYGACHTSSLG